MTGTQQYGVSAAFLDALETLANKPSWWRDVLLRDDVFIAVRSGSLNVYHCGASIFRIDDLGGGQLKPWTHAKYLVKNEQRLSTLTPDDRFEPHEISWQKYKPSETLPDMLQAAASLAGDEKRGLHPFIVRTTNVIDVEVSLARPDEEGGVSSGQKQDRMDVVTLHPDGKGRALAVFHEAKHFSNSALRAGPDREPNVVEQMQRYRKAIEHHQAALIERLRATCLALVRLAEIRNAVRATDASSANPVIIDLMHEVASGRKALSLAPVPRLIVFGFDAEQRDGRWDHEKARLTKNYSIPIDRNLKPSTKLLLNNVAKPTM